MKHKKSGAKLWNVEKIVKKGEYFYAIVLNHPRRTKNNYILLHRVLVENNLGRLLNANEVVYHVNRNKRDNKIENFIVMTRKEHNKLHGSLHKAAWLQIACPWCKSMFCRRRHRAHQSFRKWISCNLSCRGKFSRYIQLNGETQFVQNAISGNILKKFER